MKQTWKKIGWLTLSFSPMIAYLILSVIITLAGGIFLAIIGMVTGSTDVEGMLMDNLLVLQVMIQLAAIIIFGLWYYFGCGRPGLKIRKGTFNPKSTIAIMLTGLGMQFFITAALSIIGYLFPDALNSYSELMESAGLTELTWLSVITTVILAPIVEEIIFRGITIRIAAKARVKFWVVNVVQALAFGILHLNLVQGTYAFVIGLVLGWVYYRFNSLYAVIFLHFIVNLSGTTIIDPLSYILPDTILSLILLFIVGAALTVYGISSMKKWGPGCRPQPNSQIAQT